MYVCMYVIYIYHIYISYISYIYIISYVYIYIYLFVYIYIFDKDIYVVIRLSIYLNVSIYSIGCFFESDMQHRSHYTSAAVFPWLVIYFILGVMDFHCSRFSVNGQWRGMYLAVLHRVNVPE